MRSAGYGNVQPRFSGVPASLLVTFCVGPGATPVGEAKRHSRARVDSARHWPSARMPATCPIIPFVGEEIYISEGGRSKRVFLSLIRRARDPQKMVAFIASQEAEEFGMSPPAPFLSGKASRLPTKKCPYGQPCALVAFLARPTQHSRRAPTPLCMCRFRLGGGRSLSLVQESVDD